MFSGQVFQRPSNVPKAALLQNTPRAPLQPPAGGSPQVNTGGQPPNGRQGQRGQARGGAQGPAQPGTHQRSSQPYLRRQSGSQHAPQNATSSGGTNSKLDSSYKIRPPGFYVRGRVFHMLWSEPAGAGATEVTYGTMVNHLGELVYSKVRRFVVIRPGRDSCAALPISTYGGKGVGKKGITKSDHAIIYTGNLPQLLPSENPGREEDPIQPVAIRVDPDDRQNVLDPTSRLDIRGVRTIQYNVKAKALGKVNDRSLPDLDTLFRNVLDLRDPVPPPAQRTRRRQAADAEEEDGNDENESDEDGSGENEESEGQESE